MTLQELFSYTGPLVPTLKDYILTEIRQHKYIEKAMNILGIIDISDWLLLFILAIVGFYIYATWHYGYFENQGLKADPPLPLLGNISTRYANKYVHIEDQKAHHRLGSVHGVYEGRKPCLVVGDPEIIKQILVKNFANFVNRRFFNVESENKIIEKFISFMRDEEWRTTRHLLTPTFTSGKLKQMGHLMQECAFQSIKNTCEQNKLTNSKSIDVKTEFSLYTMNVISSCSFGLQANCKSTEDPIYVHSKAIFGNDFSWKAVIIFLAPWFARILHYEMFPTKSITYLKNICKDVMDTRKREGIRRPDFLQLLLDAQADEEKENISTANKSQNGNKKIVLDELCLIAQAMLFLVAGFDTVSSTMSFAVYLLAQNPNCYQTLMEEIEDAKTQNNGKLCTERIMQMPYLDMVMSETLRFYPLAARLERVSNNDIMIGDIHIKKGMMTTIPIYALHHDDKYFPDPEKFEPERFSPENKDSMNPYAYLPFGAGPRNCLGMRFAQMQTKIGLAYYLDTFQFDISTETEFPLQFRRGYPNLSLKNGLKLQMSERKQL